MKTNHEVQKKFVYLFINTFVIIVFFFAMLKIVKFNILNSNYDYILNIGQNWKNSPIIDLKVINFKDTDSNTTSCGDVNMKPLLNEYWPGTVVGCNIDNLIIPFQCHFFGNTIDAISKRKYKYWDGVEICVQRSNNTYLSLLRTAKKCPSGLKECGIIDNMGYKLCIKIDDNCPINLLVIEDKDKSLSPSFQNGSRHHIETKNKNIYFSNNFTNLSIINEVTISDITPCANPKFKNNFANSTHPLDVSYKNSHCQNFSENFFTEGLNYSLINTNYENIDTLSYQTLIHENNIYNLLLSLPGGKGFVVNGTNHQTSLFSRNYVGINHICIENLLRMGIKTDEFLNVFLSINDILSYIDKIFFVLLICFFVLFFIDFLLLIRHFMYYWFPIFNYLEKWRIKTLYIALFVLCLTCHVVCFSYMMYLDKLLDPLRVFSYLLPEYNKSVSCLDAISNGIFHSYNNSLIEIKILWYIILFLLCGNVIGFIVELLYMLELCVYSPETSISASNIDGVMDVRLPSIMKDFSNDGEANNNSFKLYLKTCEEMKTEEAYKNNEKFINESNSKNSINDEENHKSVVKNSIGENICPSRYEFVRCQSSKCFEPRPLTLKIDNINIRYSLKDVRGVDSRKTFEFKNEYRSEEVK